MIQRVGLTTATWLGIILLGPFTALAAWWLIGAVMMQATSPYVREREAIFDAFDVAKHERLSIMLDTQTALGELREELHAFTVEQAQQRDRLSAIEVSQADQLDPRIGWRAEVTERLERIEQGVKRRNP